MEEKEFILISNASIARKLLKSGFTIVDIKPHRLNKVRTVFIFKRTESILNEIESIEKEFKSKRK